MSDYTWPRSVTDGACPQGHAIEATADRRRLWHIESVLSVRARTEDERALARDLRRYLNRTCEHHWHAYPAEGDIAAHRQCLWCCDVRFDTSEAAE